MTDTRPSDLAFSGGDPAKAAARLGWCAETRGAEVVRGMVDAEMAMSGAAVA